MWSKLVDGQIEFICPHCNEVILVIEGDRKVPEHRYRDSIPSSQGKNVERLPRAVRIVCPVSGAEIVFDDAGEG